ncbi:MAG: alanine racemase [Armatimonadota bacterium]|nr:alanine racemase [Armatimonadota bacterium]MDR5697852.1 alanine racemase [Armatimonadota bacterium]
MRPAWIEVDLGAIRTNVGTARSFLGPSTRLMAVVKADAYGHGAAPVARAALEAGAAWLGVALPSEAEALRAAGIRSPVLVFGPADAEEIARGAGSRISFTVFSHAMLVAARRAANPATPVALHLEIDTGMGRAGFRAEDAVRIAGDIASTPGLILEGVFTHFATADTDSGYARQQLGRFLEAIAALEEAGHRGILRHAANSAALFTLPEAHLDMVRMGIGLYGLSCGVEVAGLRPALRVVARAVQVKRVAAGTPISYGATYRALRETAIVTVPIGYADGIPRALSNRGHAAIGGRRVRYAGRVCMDYLMLDAGDLPVAEGDEVELLGPHVPAEEVAALCETIPYEIVSRLSPRLPRRYT